MNPRSLQQILTELSGTYDPQVQSIQNQQAQLPGQIQAQEQGLQAKQTEAFDSIQAGAQQRGIGFSGVPLGEQSKYTASSYLPALANLRTAGTQQATSLQDAINQINERKNTFAQQLYGADQDRYQTLMAQQRAEAAANAQNAGLSALFGGQQNAQAGAKPGANGALTDADKAYQTVQSFVSKGRDAAISDYVATLKSANNGNPFDKLKVAAYQKAGLTSQDLAKYFASLDTNTSKPSINYGSAVGQVGNQATNLGSSLLNRLKSNAGIFNF